MSAIDILLTVLIACAVLGAAVSIIRRKKAGKGCCGDCASCGGNCSLCRK